MVVSQIKHLLTENVKSMLKNFLQRRFFRLEEQTRFAYET